MFEYLWLKTAARRKWVERGAANGAGEGSKGGGATSGAEPGAREAPRQYGIPEEHYSEGTVTLFVAHLCLPIMFRDFIFICGVRAVPDSARRRRARAAGARAEHSAATERRRADGPPSHGHIGRWWYLSQWSTSSGCSTRTGWRQLLVRGLPHWSPVIRVHYEFICNYIPFIVLITLAFNYCNHHTIFLLDCFVRMCVCGVS